MPERTEVPETTPEEIEVMQVAQAKRDRITRFMKMRVGQVYDKMFEDGMSLDDLIAWIEGRTNAELRSGARTELEKARRAGAVLDTDTVGDILTGDERNDNDSG